MGYLNTKPLKFHETNKAFRTV